MNSCHDLATAGGFSAFTRDLRLAYNRAGRPLFIPPAPFQRSPDGWLGLSYLRGACHLAKAFQKAGVEPTFPELQLGYDPYGTHRVDYGTYAENMFVEPYLWYAQNNVGFAAETQYRVDDATEKLNGYVDVKLDWLDSDGIPRSALVEIKNSHQTNGDIGTPRDNYAIQALGYALLSGITNVYILIANFKGFNLYQLRPVDADHPENGFLLYDESGELYRPAWGEDWNHPGFLNYDQVRAEAAALRDYIAQVNAWQAQRAAAETGGLTPPTFEASGIVVPEADPLNDRSTGWRCIAILNAAKHLKTKDDRPGTAQPNCAYAGLCHARRGITRPVPFDYLERDAHDRYLYPAEQDLF